MAGSITVKDLGDLTHPSKLPYSGLSLSVSRGAYDVQPNYWDLSLITQKVKRALTLWATGVITIKAVQTSHTAGKAVVLQGTLNKTTGKVSTDALIFNESNWGKQTHSYLNSIWKLMLRWAGNMSPR
jgi:hypothetical protein